MVATALLSIASYTLLLALLCHVTAKKTAMLQTGLFSMNLAIEVIMQFLSIVMSIVSKGACLQQKTYI